MADLLIKQLKEKANEHSALGVLVNQWGFDEQLIPKALQGIGNLFPHYSKHDESHSKQILVNIERLLGESISKLTAIDTWLLLEAAYWHDIGMVVPKEDIKNAFKDPAFQRYLAEIKNTPHHELHRFCRHFDPRGDVSQCFRGADTPLDATEKFRQLMAEWFRRKHPERAKGIVTDPWQRAGISSPRTELIPTRLFALLGRICQMHGMPFDAILGAEGLPYREAGLAQEDCHPRFVACLLRLGDLLDMDDNRFCPVMQRIVGDHRPRMTKAHEDKHASIRHFRLDRERIEVSAECNSVDGYLETYKWFDWLKQEMQAQMSRWLDIVPSREFGLLPMLGAIEVKLKGNQQLLFEGQRPQFSLDNEQVMTLLQGANLYSSQFMCIRELLQNAIDATLLRIWLTRPEKADDDKENKWRSPLNETPQEVFKNTPIKIELDEDKSADVPEGKTAWILKITDQGTGISREDLKHMLKIGGSKNNHFRREKINTMPEWMKPSGAFGIGFQSVFMLADEVRLTSKDIFSNEIIEMVMYNPTGEKEGLVMIETLDPDISRPYGTTLEVSFMLGNRLRHSTRYSPFVEIDLDDLLNDDDSKHVEPSEEWLKEASNSLLGILFPLDRLRIVRIESFFAHTILPIKGYFQGEERSLLPKVRSLLPNKSQKQDSNANFVEVGDQQLLLTYTPILQLGDVHTRYRGQKFTNILHLDYVEIEVDLLSGKAGKWLTINREKIAPDAMKDLQELIFKALKKQINQDLDNPKFLECLSEEKKGILSFFLRLQSIKDESCRDLARKLRDDWQQLSFAKNKRVTYASLSGKSEWIMSEAVEWDYYHQSREDPPKEEEACDLLIDSRDIKDVTAVYMNEWLLSADHSVKVLASEHYKEGKYNFRYQFSKKPQALYDDEALASFMRRTMRIFPDTTMYKLRFEGDKWEALYLKRDAILNGVIDLFDMPSKKGSFVLLPFLCSKTVSSRNLDKLAERIRPHLEKDAEVEVIRQKYDELVSYIDNDIMKPSPFWEEWREARGIQNKASPD